MSVVSSEFSKMSVRSSRAEGPTRPIFRLAGADLIQLTTDILNTNFLIFKYMLKFCKCVSKLS